MTSTCGNVLPFYRATCIGRGERFPRGCPDPLGPRRRSIRTATDFGAGGARHRHEPDAWSTSLPADLGPCQSLGGVGQTRAGDFEFVKRTSWPASGRMVSENIARRVPVPIGVAQRDTMQPHPPAYPVPGEINGTPIVFFVAKEANAKIAAGDFVCAWIPSPTQLADR